MKVMEAIYLLQQTTIEGTIKARQLAEEAVSLDPNYASAYGVLARVTLVGVWLGLSKDPQESFKQSMELLKKAIALDDSLATVRVLLGNALVMARRYDEGLAQAERALELEPTSADVLYNYATILLYIGRGEEAIPFFNSAIRLNPKPPNLYLRHLASAYRDTGRYEEAISLIKKVIEREPRDIISHIILTATYSMAGREEDARAAAVEILKINPHFSLERFVKVHPYKDPVMRERYYNSLRKAGLT
jgi:tetratricopeptide (TPR) repeat protein